MTKISLLHPSRGRPEKSLATDKYWLERAGNIDVELIIMTDESDPKAVDYYPLYSPYNPKHFVVTKNNDSVVQATNRLAEGCSGDILVYLSDDFKCPENWGELLIREFEEDRPLLVKVDDCLQKFDVPVLTIPIMNRALYERLGYFWHPDFKSMFCDEHLYWVTRKLGALKMAPHLAFPHEHPANGKAPDDETYRRSAANWNQGKAAFERHKANGFQV